VARVAFPLGLTSDSTPFRVLSEDLDLVYAPPFTAELFFKRLSHEADHIWQFGKTAETNIHVAAAPAFRKHCQQTRHIVGVSRGPGFSYIVETISDIK
jgi:hypothetical protein